MSKLTPVAERIKCRLEKGLQYAESRLKEETEREEWDAVELANKAGYRDGIRDALKVINKELPNQSKS